MTPRAMPCRPCRSCRMRAHQPAHRRGRNPVPAAGALGDRDAQRAAAHRAERAVQAAALVQSDPAPGWSGSTRLRGRRHAGAAAPGGRDPGQRTGARRPPSCAPSRQARSPCLITKPTIAGFGLNWQHAHQMVFAGLSYSFEQPYQALRRMWRFGQPHPVTAHLVLADTEQADVPELPRASTRPTPRMQHALVAALQWHGLVLTGSPQIELSAPVRAVAEGPDYTLTLGDCVAVTRRPAAGPGGSERLQPAVLGPVYVHAR
jgi:hypothetical protein